jgi:hypothetical protein
MAITNDYSAHIRYLNPLPWPWPWPWPWPPATESSEMRHFKGTIERNHVLFFSSMSFYYRNNRGSGFSRHHVTVSWTIFVQSLRVRNMIDPVTVKYASVPRSKTSSRFPIVSRSSRWVPAEGKCSSHRLKSMWLLDKAQDQPKLLPQVEELLRNDVSVSENRWSHSDMKLELWQKRFK